LRTVIDNAIFMAGLLLSTGKPEVIDSFVGLVTVNGLVGSNEQFWTTWSASRKLQQAGRFLQRLTALSIVAVDCSL
jgi:hypothetical protein